MFKINVQNGQMLIVKKNKFRSKFIGYLKQVARN